MVPRLGQLRLGVRQTIQFTIIDTSGMTTVHDNPLRLVNECDGLDGQVTRVLNTCTCFHRERIVSGLPTVHLSKQSRSLRRRDTRTHERVGLGGTEVVPRDTLESSFLGRRQGTPADSTIRPHSDRVVEKPIGRVLNVARSCHERVLHHMRLGEDSVVLGGVRGQAP